MVNKRIERRKDFSYYMQLSDATTRELIGHLADISTGGFKLDSVSPIPIEKEFRFHLELTADVAEKPFMVFSAQSKWSQADPIDPFVYNTGFHLIKIHPTDRDIFIRVLQKYGKTQQKTGGTGSLSHRSNQWL